MITEERIIEEWCRTVHVFYSLARGERLGELNGRRARLIDERGLHPLSVEMGRILALQDMLPGLEELGFNFLAMKRAAQEDAAEQYELDTALKVGLRNRWITSTQAEAIRRASQERGHVEVNSRR